MTDADYSFKIITLGESGAGKTKILIRYKDNKYEDNNISTIGVDCQYKMIKYEKQNIKLLLYDTGGQEKFKSIVRNYYNNANGVILVYDISSERSFSKLQYWVKEIKSYNNDNSIFILFGNKNDLEEERKISFEDGKEFADQNKMEFLEGSAKTGKNIKKLFDMLVRNIIKKEMNDELYSLKTQSHILNKKRIDDKGKCC